MNFRTFFLLLFLISISICLVSTFFPDILKNILQNINMKFIALTSLIISIFSYIGMIISFFFARKREKVRLKKLEEDRKNMDKIHKELNSLH